jgi:hypothetical protein
MFSPAPSPSSVLVQNHPITIALSDVGVLALSSGPSDRTARLVIYRELYASIYKPKVNRLREDGAKSAQPLRFEVFFRVTAGCCTFNPVSTIRANSAAYSASMGP